MILDQGEALAPLIGNQASVVELEAALARQPRHRILQYRVTVVVPDLVQIVDWLQVNQYVQLIKSMHVLDLTITTTWRCIKSVLMTSHLNIL
jgi:hypothetical protein